MPAGMRVLFFVPTDRRDRNRRQAWWRDGMLYQHGFVVRVWGRGLSSIVSPMGIWRCPCALCPAWHLQTCPLPVTWSLGMYLAWKTNNKADILV